MGVSITSEQISELLAELKGSPATQARMGSYQTISDHLGREYIESERYGAYASKADRQRFQWEQSDDASDMTVNISLLHQILEDQRTVLGAARSVRVPLPDPTQQAYADRLERAIAFLWKVWAMRRVMSEVAWYAVAFGTGVGVLQWDKKNRLPRFVARSPENLYAQPSVDNEREPQRAIFVLKTLGRSLNHEYGLNLDPAREYEVLDYYDAEERVRVVKDEKKGELLRAKNTIQRVPVFLFPGILVPNSLFGASMFLRAVPIEREVNRLYSAQAMYLRDATEAPMVIRDPENVPANARWNRDSVIEVGSQGGVGRAPIASIDGQMLAMRLADMKDNLNATMDFSPLAQGKIGGSTVTGKGVNALLAPIEQRLRGKLQTIDPVYEDVNRCALLMWRKAGRKPVPIYGERAGSMFTDIIDPKADIDPGWVENIVFLDAAALVDRQAMRITMLQELRGEPQALSVRRYLELSPDCDDVEAEMARMKQERRERMQEQMEMQAQMAQAQPQPQAEVNYAAERGGAIEGAPPAGPPAAAPPGGPETAMGGGMPPGLDMGEETETVEAVADLFRDMRNIKGRMWLVGAAVDGLAPEELAQAFLEVVVSDPLDKQTVLNALRKTPLAVFADAQRVAFHEDLAVLERVPSLEVTPGSEGYEPQVQAADAEAQEAEEMTATGQPEMMPEMMP